MILDAKGNKAFDSEINILEEECIVKGEAMVLFHVPGCAEGVAVSKQDLDAGIVTRKSAYKELAKDYGY